MRGVDDEQIGAGPDQRIDSIVGIESGSDRRGNRRHRSNLQARG